VAQTINVIQSLILPFGLIPIIHVTASPEVMVGHGPPMHLLRLKRKGTGVRHCGLFDSRPCSPSCRSCCCGDAAWDEQAVHAHNVVTHAAVLACRLPHVLGINLVCCLLLQGDKWASRNSTTLALSAIATAVVGVNVFTLVSLMMDLAAVRGTGPGGRDKASGGA
jgi:Mn2+/Fe2+ NRAMP family transporter